MVNIYDLAFSKNLLKVIWDKVFKYSPSKICRRQSLKNLKRYGLPRQIFDLFKRTHFTNNPLPKCSSKFKLLFISTPKNLTTRISHILFQRIVDQKKKGKKSNIIWNIKEIQSQRQLIPAN